jgi:hypothetical protein
MVFRTTSIFIIWFQLEKTNVLVSKELGIRFLRLVPSSK